MVESQLLKLSREFQNCRSYEKLELHVSGAINTFTLMSHAEVTSLSLSY